VASIVDCPGHEDYINNMIAGSKGSDFGILLVAATEGVAPQTTQHVSLASALGIKRIFVVYNKMDTEDAKELIDVVEMEVQELIKDFNLELAGSTQLSATEALKNENELEKIKPVLEFIDDLSFEELESEEDFRMPITAIYNPKGQGVIVTGIIEGGKALPGDELEVVGMGKPLGKGSLLKIEFHKKEVPHAKKRMDVGLQIKGLKKEEICKGMVVVKKGKSFLVDSFRAMLKVSKPHEGDKEGKTGRKNPFKVGFEPQLFVGQIGIDITCRISSIIGSEYAKPGDAVEIEIELKKPMMIFEGDRFFLRESNKDVGLGKVLSIKRL